MRINIARQNGTLSLPTDFATLEDITKDGRLHYVVKYNIDMAKALKDKASLVRISVSVSPTDIKDATGFVRLNSQEIIQNLLTRQSERVEANRAFANSFVTSIVSDITSRLPNNKAKDLAPTTVQHNVQNYDNVKLTAEKFLFQRRSFKLVKASELTAKNVSQPTLQTPLHQPPISEVAPVMSPQEHGYNLILKYGIDPAQVGNRTGLVADTERVQAGILQRPRGVARDVLTDGAVGSIRSTFGILNNLLGDPKGKPVDQQGLANSDYTHVQVDEVTNTITIEEDLFLNISDVGDQFYLIFELQDTKTVQTEMVSSVVHHSRNLAVFALPIRPAFISATPCTGYNRLELKQLDPNGSGVFIYRKILNTHSAITSADYVQIAKVPLRVQDGSKWYNDPNPGMQPVLYRVVTYNRAELKGHDFASAVVNPPQRMPMVKASAQQKKLFISLNAKVVDKTIQLELNDIPPGVLSMRVYRRDLSRHESLSEATQIGNTVFLQKLPSPNMRFYVTDTTPVDQRIYEYRVMLVFRDGTQLWSTACTEIQYNPILNNVISTTATPIKGVNVGVDLDVQFTLTSVIAEGKMDQIKKAMDQQGILGFFQDDITQNRELLQNLIAYQVKRTNLTTSEIEDMGVFIGTDFSDRAVGKNKGVKPIQNGHTYEYTINTHFRSASSLIDTFTSTVTDTTNPNRTYSFAPSKWQHPVTLLEGNLVTSTSLQRNHANSDFTFGTVGDILHLRIALTVPEPAVHKAGATSLGKGKVLLQWELKGDAKQIDHFLVVKEEMGMKSVVGKVHALTDARNLQFIDTPALPTSTTANPTQNIPVGSLVNTGLETAAIYHVTPVLYDLSHGPSGKSPQVITKKLK